MLPNKHNFCGGNFGDWLEVFLTAKCNGGCNWCIEKGGYHPTKRVSVSCLAKTILNSGKKNVILLGGEPTIYPDISKLVKKIADKVDVFITTNGFMLTPDFILDNLVGVKGINISVHHYNLKKNQEVTKIILNQETLEWSIWVCRNLGIITRLNCNIIKGYVDSRKRIYKYIKWAKATGIDKIRFAELKNSNLFINLKKIFGGEYELNENPYVDGCNKDVIINDMPVNFRQMCGLQTPMRKCPVSPKFIGTKQVLYYDGVTYEGWQRNKNRKKIAGKSQRVKEKN